ncbi:vWA domain-containing protein [Yoonia sp. 2307UL14-13]|uniref:vWA domain-containing protein n=1 Tax=Yoonia sp. 2307UL14-13 TaxID=3126506 RepID=UPI003097845E
MRLISTFAIPFLCFANPVVAQGDTATSDVLFVLDGSGSMWGRVDEVEKIVVAKEVMTGLIDGLPQDIDVGLIAYGHRERGACSDIEVIATPGETARPDLLGALSGITPQGKTPIADSLVRAGELLRENEDLVSIVLVSDGIESCDGDPCATAATLREQGIDVTIHVVGFDVDEAADQQLSCIAENGGGEYYQAGSADALNAALTTVRETIVEAAEEPAPEPVVTTLILPLGNMVRGEDVIGGIDVVDAETNETIVRLTGTTEEQVQPGTYVLEFDNFISPPLPVEAGEDYVISAVDYGLARVVLDGEQIGGVDMIVDATDEKVTRLAGTNVRQVPPGTYRLEFDNFTSPPIVVEPSGDYTFAASDFALADIVLDGTQVGGVDVINADTGEKLTRLAGTNEKQIPPGTYIFEFDNFTSPPRVIEGSTSVVVSPSDYGLADIVMNGTQAGGVDMIDEETGEKLTRLAGQNEQQIPPGTYRFEFDHYTSPPRAIAPGDDVVISPSDYGLVTVSKVAGIDGALGLYQDGERVVNLTGTSERQIAPGTYTMVYKRNELGQVTLTEGEVRVFALE